MSESDGAARHYSLFRSLINARRLDDATLRILESFIVFKDVNSLLDVCSSLREFLRSEYVHVVREVAEKTFERKLSALEFFVRSFALIGDFKSCLALRYEALVLREHKSASNQWLRVSYTEWLNFAEQSLNNGFCLVAIKACDSALRSLKCPQKRCVSESQPSENEQVIEKVKRLKDCALNSAASHSVQAQTAGYLKRKNSEKGIATLALKKQRCLASTRFKNGIKKRNLRKLKNATLQLAESKLHAI